MELVITGRSPDVLADSFTVSTNEDWSRDYQLKHGGSPIRIENGWKIFMQLQKVNTGDLAITISTDNQRIVILDRDAGKYGLRVKQADAAQIPPAQYSYDIVLVAGDGIYRLARGTIEVEQGITNVPGQEKWSHFPLILRP
jgi:hypothetical protein